MLNALEAARTRGMGVLGLVNVLGSTLMKESERYLPPACGYEISVPATKTFVNQVVAFLHLALRMGNHSTELLHSLPGLIETTVAQTETTIDGIETRLKTANDCTVWATARRIPLRSKARLDSKK